MANQLQEKFRGINTVLMGVINVAVAKLLDCENDQAKHCFTTSAWTGARKLAELLPSLPKPFYIPVKSCVDACAEAMKEMPKPDTTKEKYPVAAESLTLLAGELDKLRESNT